MAIITNPDRIRLSYSDRKLLENTEEQLQEAFKHLELVKSDLEEIDDDSEIIDDSVYSDLETLMEQVAKMLEDVQSRLAHDDALEEETMRRDSQLW